MKNAHTHFQTPLDWGSKIKGQYGYKGNILRYLHSSNQSLGRGTGLISMDNSKPFPLVKQVHSCLTLAGFSGSSKKEANFYDSHKFMFPLQHLWKSETGVRPPKYLQWIHSCGDQTTKLSVNVGRPSNVWKSWWVGKCGNKIPQFCP